MRPPRIEMDRSGATDHTDHAAPSGGSVSLDTSDNASKETQLCHARQRAEKVANASVKLKQLLRKQTLAYQCHVMDAVRNNDVAELRRFLEDKEGKLNVNFFDSDGQTALHLSCIEGNFELVKLLVRFGANTKLANRDGWNPLHIATFGGHNDIVLFLINMSRTSNRNSTSTSQ